MENYTIKKCDDIEYLQFNKLLEFQDDLKHAFTLKTYNVGLDKKDTNIDFNFNKISNILNIEKEQIYKPKQSHSSNIVEITDGKEDLINVDGLITDRINKALVISIADCICLMMYDPKNKVIANIHSGWKGTLQKIGQKAVNIMMNDYNCRPDNIICCIGPSIRKDHFLVNKDVEEMFESKFSDYIKHNQIIEETNECNEKGKQYKIDSVLINKLMLEELGLLSKNIIDSNICTICNKDKFHSYRAEGEDFCKNMGIMMLR